MSDCCSVDGKPAVAPSVMACPVNGARSKKVDLLPVRSLVRHLPMGMPSAQYYFCEAPDCDVVYFSSNPQAPIFRRAELLVRVGAKESGDPIPVCYCFGFTRKDIQDEIAKTGRSTVAARITAEVQAGNCACEVKNPSGKCCLGAVTRTVQECLRAMPKAREEIAGQRKVVGGQCGKAAGTGQVREEERTVGSVMNMTPLCRNSAFAGLALNATVLFFVPFLSAQQSNTPLTLDAALAYARQHSPRLSAKRQGVTTEQAAMAAARAERLPRFNLGAAVRGSNQPTQTALGLPLTPLADVPENQPFRRGHLNAEVRATIPVYTGGRISSVVSLAQAQRDLAQVSVRDVERGLDFDVRSTYASLVQLDRDIEAAQESVNALTESRRVVAQMLDEGKVARVDLLKVDTRLADVQDTAIEFRNAREIEAGQINALLGRPIDTPVIVEMILPPPSAQLSLDQVSQLARTGNLKYQLAEAQVSVAERSVAVAKSAQRPSLSLAADLLGQSADPFAVYKRCEAGI